MENQLKFAQITKHFMLNRKSLPQNRNSSNNKNYNAKGHPQKPILLIFDFKTWCIKYIFVCTYIYKFQLCWRQQMEGEYHNLPVAI